MTNPFSGADTPACDPQKDKNCPVDLHNRVMTDDKTAAAQTIQVNVVISQPEREREPTHLKVHRNPLSVVVHAVGHFGKEYALGVRDSVKPRNLGMETLPIALNEYNAIRIGQGLKQLGQGEQQLAAGEQQLGAGLTQIGNQLGALEGAGGAAVRVGAVARVGTVAKVGPVARAEVSPKIATNSPSAEITPGTANLAGTAGVSGEGVIATPTPITLPNGGLMSIAVTTNGGGGDVRGVTTAGAPVTTENQLQFLPNQGVNANGDIVAMTPKQLAKAQEYKTKSANEEVSLQGALGQYSAQLADVQKSMAASQTAPAWFNMLDQRMTYFKGYDQAGDHKSARAWLSDANQCVDNLKRDAQASHNDDAVRKLEALKRSVKELDSIEKKFGKTPDVVLPA